MAGIFNLFGGTSFAAKQQSSLGPNDSSVQTTMKPTIFGATGPMAGKSVASTPSKPRGLSMRSNSQLNVTRANGTSETSPRKKSPNKVLAKAYFGPSECLSQSMSPRSVEKSLKMQIIKSKQLKALSSKTKSPGSDLDKKQAEEVTFKKPLMQSFPSKRKANLYPEPEKLAYYYDEKKALNCVIDHEDREFIDFVKLSKAPVKPYQDEGFESDPETIPVSTVPMLDVSAETPLDNVSDTVDMFELVALSDDDDDHFFD